MAGLLHTSSDCALFIQTALKVQWWTAFVMLAYNQTKQSKMKCATKTLIFCPFAFFS